MVFDKNTMSTLANYGINIVIALLGIYLWVRSTQNNNALKTLIIKLDDALPHEKKIKKWADKEMVIESSSEKEQPERIAQAEDEFGDISAKYNMHCQLVTVFPLLGILGTVFGIILMGDITISSGTAFALALWTTFWGLVASIVLKIKFSLGTGKNISKFENKVDSYYRSLEMIRIREKMNNQQ